MNNRERLQSTVNYLIQRYPTWCSRSTDVLGYTFKPVILYQPGHGYWLRTTACTQQFIGRTWAIAGNWLEQEAARLKAAQSVKSS